MSIEQDQPEGTKRWALIEFGFSDYLAVPLDLYVKHMDEFLHFERQYDAAGSLVDKLQLKAKEERDSVSIMIIHDEIIAAKKVRARLTTT